MFIYIICSTYIGYYHYLKIYDVKCIFRTYVCERDKKNVIYLLDCAVTFIERTLLSQKNNYILKYISALNHY